MKDTFDLDILIPQKPQRRRNGTFAKGHIPHNKGKKWSGWMDGRKARRVRRGLKRTGRNDIGGWNKKPIIAMKDDKEYWFESAASAARTLNLISRNIRSVASGQRKHCGGWKFRFTNQTQH